MEITITQPGKETIVQAISGNMKAPIQVLLVGNNPMELSHLYEGVKKCKNAKMQPEICFKAEDSYLKSVKLKPDCIVADDSLSFAQIEDLIEKISKDVRTKDIPVVVLTHTPYKNLNSMANEILIKEDFDHDKLAHTVSNMIKEKKIKSSLRGQLTKVFLQIFMWIFDIKDLIIKGWKNLKKLLTFILPVHPA
jgi:PleD family two-component response regulator